MVEIVVFKSPRSGPPLRAAKPSSFPRDGPIVDDCPNSCYKQRLQEFRPRAFSSGALVKSYLPMAVAAGLVVVVLAAAIFLTPALASPRARLQDEIATNVATAQAMLAAYTPIDAGVLRDFDPAVTSQPATATQPSTDLSAEVRSTLQARQNLIADALNEVQKALSTEVGGVRGDSSVAATRLEAILLTEQGQNLRREAEFHWMRATRMRRQLLDVLASWSALDAQVRSHQATLSGQGSLTAAASSQPADAAADSQPASAVAEAPASQPARAALPPDCTLQMSLDQIRERQTQSPEQRVADLRLCHTKVEGDISDAQKAADALSDQIQKLRQQIDAAKAESDAAQKKMLALEHKGVDATDPKSLPGFTQEYTEASNAYRRALRTISILTSGSTKEPRVTPEEKEMLPEPPIALGNDLQQEHRGVAALEGDLATAQGQVETQKKLLAQIDAEIDRLTKTQKQLQDQVAGLEAARARLSEEIATRAKEVIAEVVQAYQLESQSIDVLDGKAHNAARRAQSAASAGGTSDQFSVGYAKTLGGDVDAATARVLSQRAAGLESHAHFLARLAPAGLSAVALQPAGSTEPPPAWAGVAKAALDEAAKSSSEAIQKATAALEIYNDAQGGMKQLWTVQAQIAAIHYLLANLTTGPESAKHLADAKNAYNLATRDRKDRPEVQPLKAIYEKLTQAK